MGLENCVRQLNLGLLVCHCCCVLCSKFSAVKMEPCRFAVLPTACRSPALRHGRAQCLDRGQGGGRCQSRGDGFVHPSLNADIFWVNIVFIKCLSCFIIVYHKWLNRCMLISLNSNKQKHSIVLGYQKVEAKSAGFSIATCLKSGISGRGWRPGLVTVSCPTRRWIAK